jgi:hypothetical protein
MNEPSEGNFPGGDTVRQAYNGLSPIEPTTEMDQVILKYARASTRASRNRWVWPASLAAGILVTLGIVSQMAQIVPSGSYPRSPVLETVTREPRAAAASGEFNQSQVMQSQTIEVKVPGRSVDAWLEQLQNLAEQGKSKEFVQALKDARQDYPDLELPQALSAWAEAED